MTKKIQTDSDIYIPKSVKKRSLKTKEKADWIEAGLKKLGRVQGCYNE